MRRQDESRFLKLALEKLANQKGYFTIVFTFSSMIFFPLVKLPRMPTGKTRPDNDLELFKVSAKLDFFSRYPFLFITLVATKA